MSKAAFNFNKSLASVYTDDFGRHAVLTPSGKEPLIVCKTEVIDDVNGMPIAIVTMPVNLVQSKEQVEKLYTTE